MSNAAGQEPFFLSDPYLDQYRDIIRERRDYAIEREKFITADRSLADFAMGHHYYGLHLRTNSWIFREWAPNATAIWLTGTFSQWKKEERFRMRRINSTGDWEIELPGESIRHLDLYKLAIEWEGGSGDRIPSYASRVVQDPDTKIFSAQIWHPDEIYKWKNNSFDPGNAAPLVYEAHTGMATEAEAVGTYREFTDNILPYIARAGYNTVQLMAVQEHPYYGSFGYHVSNFFAVSSRFGTPDDFRELIDTAHSLGLRVIIDLIHSHSVRNENEGLGLFDGTLNQYFHGGDRRIHTAWDSLCFDYGKPQVVHFLLSNCQYWLEEYKVDGFRFDGITSMIYFDHGLGKNFVSYADYYNGNQDKDAIVYLTLANKLIHSVNPAAITIAEEMSGIPGLGAPVEKMGMGFDFRLAMGIPDYWIKLVKDKVDETWQMGEIFHELSQHRPEEKTISYCESHDQALVGDKTLIFRMTDAEMYYGMSNSYSSIKIDRAIALHKMIRLLTLATSGGGYLAFMGNEFGHPEWIDFPREGNNWSMKYARRQWSLLQNSDLKFSKLAAFDKAMLSTVSDFDLYKESTVELLVENDNDKTLAFRRGRLLFVFNFNPERSFTDYGIPVKGTYEVVTDTDRKEFGGYNRIQAKGLYRSVPGTGRYSLTDPLQLKLYLPARTGMVLLEKKSRGIKDL